MIRAEALSQLAEQFKADGIVSFKVDEFVPARMAPPTVTMVHRIPLIARVCQDLRYASDAPVWITSGYRDPIYNSRLDPPGAELSQHVEGTASDVVSKVWTPTQVADWADKHPWAKFMGIGRYNSFTHLDVRGFFPFTPGARKQPAPARWDNT